MLRLLLPLLLAHAEIPGTQWDAFTMQCPPPELEAKVRKKAYEWKRDIEARWCTKDRSSRYTIVIHCSKTDYELPHTTTFHFAGSTSEVIDRANVDIDPAAADILDRGLPHGLVHAILPGCMPKEIAVFGMPGWALEGSAQSHVPSLVDDARRLWGSKLSAETVQPLSRFLFTDSRALTYYTQAGMFVRYLLSMGGAEKFKGMIVDLGFGETPPALSLAHQAQYERVFRKRYDKGIAELDEGFRKYLAAEMAAAP